ncbi:hypothetical protein Desti_0154 [Desulfomonile tiedjei DSM 6799]|uniref:Uncharacterized protein n=1 Tax=Desulfomonile tiedjei (strain ATCC 49306 / DSM 6799 / DCB-1) TaxID=706587 RepID=I4C009_DESTA|nr:hypothetical protein Desti_0154 [Desulfomonile tiedjei DSM 6799]
MAVIASEAKQSPDIKRLIPSRLSRETRDRCAPRNDNYLLMFYACEWQSSEMAPGRSGQVTSLVAFTILDPSVSGLRVRRFRF